MKKTAADFDLTANSLLEKYETILIKLKIWISQLIAKGDLQQRGPNQIRECLTGHTQI